MTSREAVKTNLKPLVIPNKNQISFHNIQVYQLSNNLLLRKTTDRLSSVVQQQIIEILRIAHLAVNIIRSQSPNHHVHILLVDRNSREVVLRVTDRSLSTRGRRIAGTSQKFTHVVNVTV